MPSAADEIRDAIAAAGGAISFERFMELALYGADGFYTSGGSAGRRGDFITSAEVGPLFGAVLASALDAWWDELGRPDPFTVVEVGAGPGTLARAIAIAAPRCWDVTRYVAVEVAAAQRERHPDWVETGATLEIDRFVGVVLANELLDNIPFRLFVRDGAWREAFVVANADGTFAEVLRDADDVAAFGLPEQSPHGARVPVQQRAGQWVAAIRERVSRGRVVVFDYGVEAVADLAMRPWRDWLRTYAGQQRGQHYLRQPGAQDITADVAFDIIARVAGVPTICTQADFLRLHGIDELVEQGRQAWHDAASAPTVAALRMRSRIAEAEALLDPLGLGGFAVLTWSEPDLSSTR